MSQYSIGYSSLDPLFGEYLLDIAGDHTFDIIGKLGSPATYLQIRSSEDCHLHINSVVENSPVDIDGYRSLKSIDITAGLIYTVDKGFPIRSVIVHYSGASLNYIEMKFK